MQQDLFVNYIDDPPSKQTKILLLYKGRPLYWVQSGKPDQPAESASKFGPMPKLLTAKEERMIVAKVLELAVRNIMGNHCYTFKNKTYKQRTGEAIGLMLTGVVTQNYMSRWA